MKEIEKVLSDLKQSGFRNRIHLQQKELDYLHNKGMSEVLKHATATCCRGCLQKWHQIPRGRALTTEEQKYIVQVIGAWLSREDAGEMRKTGNTGHAP